jgi:hypothetical protein
VTSALLLALVVAQAPARVDVEADFAYGFGARSAFGALAVGSARWSLYETSDTRGALEAGLLVGYQNEPWSQTAALVLPSVVSGATHRVEVLALAGHTLSLLASRRLELGLLLFAGWTHVVLRGALRSDAQGFDRAYAADASEFTFGLSLRAGFQLTDRFSVGARFFLPVPYAGVAISSYFTASAGLAFRL